MPILGELLKNRAFLLPNKEAISSESRMITYERYYQIVNQFAHYLKEKKVQKGDRVALLCQNTYAFPLIYLATVTIGAVVVPINWRLKPDEIKWILHNCEANTLFYDKEFEQIIPTVEKLEHVKNCICIGVEPFENVFRNQPNYEPITSIEENDPALIIYTSGTTGKPKGVVCSHKNVYNAALANLSTLDFHQDDRFLFVTPLFHISGMVLMIASIIRGFTLVLHKHFDPVVIWDVMESEKITHIMSVPAMLTCMLEPLKNRTEKNKVLRGIICGGSKVPEKLIRSYYELGHPVYQVYGATEFTGSITYSTPEMGLEASDSVGKKLYLTQLEIVDPHTKEALPYGETGEVICKGEQTFLEYWNNPEETKKVKQKGWYYTKDIGKLDENGLLYIIDRLKDMIIYNGEKIFPAQVEAIIQELEGVKEVAVVGIEDPVYGELPRAYVVKKEGASLTQQDVLTHARRHLADYKLHDTVFIKELPKNSMGKVMKFLLKEYA